MSVTDDQFLEDFEKELGDDEDDAVPPPPPPDDAPGGPSQESPPPVKQKKKGRTKPKLTVGTSNPSQPTSTGANVSFTPPSSTLSISIPTAASSSAHSQASPTHAAVVDDSKSMRAHLRVGSQQFPQRSSMEFDSGAIMSIAGQRRRSSLTMPIPTDRRLISMEEYLASRAAAGGGGGIEEKSPSSSASLGAASISRTTTATGASANGEARPTLLASNSGSASLGVGPDTGAGAGHKRVLSSSNNGAQELAFTKTLTTPLHKGLPAALQKTAMQAFKNISGYMGDRSSSKSTDDHAFKLLRNGIKGPSVLRDEIYAQLCKQTTNNPQSKSLAKGWELMAFSCGVFPPSEAFVPFVTEYFTRAHKYFASRTTGEDKSIQKQIVYCREMLPNTVANGPRAKAPCVVELDSIRQIPAQPVWIRVILPNWHIENVRVFPQTTTKEVCQYLYQKLGFADGIPTYNGNNLFGLVQVAKQEWEREAKSDPSGSQEPMSPSSPSSPKNRKIAPALTEKELVELYAQRMAEQRGSLIAPGPKGMEFDYRREGWNDDIVIADGARLLDVVAGWYDKGDSGEKGTSAKKQAKIDPIWRFMFRPKIYPAWNKLSKEGAMSDNALHMYFVDATYKLSHGIFGLSADEAYKAASIHFQAEFGDIIDESKIEKYLYRYFSREFLSQSGYHGSTKKQVATQLLARVSKLQKDTQRLVPQNVAKLLYLELLATSPFFGQQFVTSQLCIDTSLNEWNNAKTKAKGDLESALKGFSGKNAVSKPVDMLIGVGEKGLYHVKADETTSSGFALGSNKDFHVDLLETVDATQLSTSPTVWCYALTSVPRVYVFKGTQGETVRTLVSFYQDAIAKEASVVSLAHYSSPRPPLPGTRLGAGVSGGNLNSSPAPPHPSHSSKKPSSSSIDIHSIVSSLPNPELPPPPPSD